MKILTRFIQRCCARSLYIKHLLAYRPHQCRRQVKRLLLSDPEYEAVVNTHNNDNKDIIVNKADPVNPWNSTAGWVIICCSGSSSSNDNNNNKLIAINVVGCPGVQMPTDVYNNVPVIGQRLLFSSFDNLNIPIHLQRTFTSTIPDSTNRSHRSITVMDVALNTFIVAHALASNLKKKPISNMVVNAVEQRWKCFSPLMVVMEEYSSDYIPPIAAISPEIPGLVIETAECIINVLAAEDIERPRDDDCGTVATDQQLDDNGLKEFSIPSIMDIDASTVDILMHPCVIQRATMGPNTSVLLPQLIEIVCALVEGMFNIDPSVDSAKILIGVDYVRPNPLTALSLRTRDIETGNAVYINVANYRGVTVPRDESGMAVTEENLLRHGLHDLSVPMELGKTTTTTKEIQVLVHPCIVKMACRNEVICQALSSLVHRYVAQTLNMRLSRDLVVIDKSSLQPEIRIDREKVKPGFVVGVHDMSRGKRIFVNIVSCPSAASTKKYRVLEPVLVMDDDCGQCTHSVDVVFNPSALHASMRSRDQQQKLVHEAIELLLLFSKFKPVISTAVILEDVKYKEMGTEAGFVVESREKVNGKRVFVNIVSSDAVDRPTKLGNVAVHDDYLDHYGIKGLQVPFVMMDPFPSCVYPNVIVVNVAFNPCVVWRSVHGRGSLRNDIITLAMKYVAKISGMCLDMSRVRMLLECGRMY